MQTPVAAAPPLAAQITVPRRTAASTAVSAPKIIPAVLTAPTPRAADQSIPAEPTTATSTRQALPFTGLDIQIVMLIGLLMLLAGAALRINATRPKRRGKG